MHCVVDWVVDDCEMLIERNLKCRWGEFFREAHSYKSHVLCNKRWPVVGVRRKCTCSWRDGRTDTWFALASRPAICALANPRAHTNGLVRAQLSWLASPIDPTGTLSNHRYSGSSGQLPSPTHTMRRTHRNSHSRHFLIQGQCKKRKPKHWTRN